MELRPHHLLCIQKFTGHGYNEAFTRHMKWVSETLRANTDIKITLVEGCDSLCSMCPNNVGGACSSLDKVELMDKNVLSICNLSYGEKLTWAEASENAVRKIFKTDSFIRICESCQWFELCKNTEV